MLTPSTTNTHQSLFVNDLGQGQNPNMSLPQSRPLAAVEFVPVIAGQELQSLGSSSSQGNPSRFQRRMVSAFSIGGALGLVFMPCRLRPNALNTAVFQTLENGIVLLDRSLLGALCKLKLIGLGGRKFIAPYGGITCHFQHVQQLPHHKQVCTPFFGVSFFLLYTFFWCSF